MRPRILAGSMANGSYARIILATADLDWAVARLQASGADVVQAPTEQPYGFATAPSAIRRAPDP
jgi:predicted enzyme related to lactoylglutathione lyase